MARIMRALVCIGVLDEEGEETYVQNLPLMNPAARAMIRGMAKTTDMMPQLPDYLVSLNYRNPNDRHDPFFGFARKADLNMYEWLQAHPEQMQSVNEFQSANAQLNEGSVQWILGSLLVSDGSLGRDSGYSEQSDDRVLLVDVGGGRGEPLRTFRRNHPELRGRLVMEDLPKVAEGQRAEEGVEAIAHDFFTRQPIKGTSIYFFHFISHNWPTSACREILRHTISAMAPPSSSKIIISDLLLPSTNAGPFETLMDLQMIAFGGMERRERQWRELLEGEGLRIERFERPEEGAQVPECLIACVVAAAAEEEVEDRG